MLVTQSEKLTVEDAITYNGRFASIKEISNYPNLNVNREHLQDILREMLEEDRIRFTENGYRLAEQ